jgi:hypothetical protein
MSEQSTTSDLVELTRRSVEPSNERDFDAILSFYAPDAALDLSSLGVGTFQGASAIRRFFQDWSLTRLRDPRHSWPLRCRRVSAIRMQSAISVNVGFANPVVGNTAALPT